MLLLLLQQLLLVSLGLNLMVRKILDACALVGLLVSASLAGGSFYLYRYVTSPSFEKEVKEKLMKEVTGSLKMPELSGPVLPTAKPKMSLPKF